VRAADGVASGTAQTQHDSTSASQQAPGSDTGTSGPVGDAPAGPTSGAAGAGTAAPTAVDAPISAQAPGTTTSGAQGPTGAAADPESSDDTTNDVAPVAEGGASAGSGDSPAAGDAAETGPEQDSSVGQAANATAGAGQEGVGNTQTSVRVDQPGDGTPVSQANQADANAQATANAQVAATTGSPSPPANDPASTAGTTPSAEQGPTASSATSDQSAGATAAATQTGVQNTAVDVRVGSPGANAPVDQANAASAGASTSVTPPANGQGTVAESATATATQTGATNTNVSIRVFSPGSDGAVTQTNTATAAADTSGSAGATATATQTGVQNTNVTIRVGSAGTSGGAAQQSTTSTGNGVSATTNGIDTNLAVTVGGSNLGQPGANGLQVWVWTWNWNRDESQGAPAPPNPDPSTWNWNWGSGNAQVTTRPATSDDQAAGSWTWNWGWQRDGAPDWTWQWNWAAQLPCGSCIWIWNWDWNWQGQPAQQGTSPAAAQTSNNAETAGQANVAVADAQATVTADVTQTITQDGGPGNGQYAGQLVTIDQSADATATASQSDVESVATAGRRGPLVNRVTSVASVAVGAEVSQDAGQSLFVDESGDGGATQWSGQEVDLVQQGRADVTAVQRDITLRQPGTVVADGKATTTAAATVDQRVSQESVVVGGSTDQWAGQLAFVEQSGNAVSIVGQSGVAAPRPVAGTARARSISGQLADVDQSVGQRAVRGGGVATQTAMQAVYVGQDGTAAAATTQQAGSASGTRATSDADASNRALVVQNGTQESSGTSGADSQDLAQQSIVVQVALASSTSSGGIAGRAVVVNCSIVQQGAFQSLAGGPGAATSPDLSGFCAPPAQMPTATSAVSLSSSSLLVAPAPALASASAPSDDDVAVTRTSFPSSRSKAASRVRATTPRLPSVRFEPGARRPDLGSAWITQISAPQPTQARIDTRPAGDAGDGDAGAELPLPPAGGPFAWVSALAAAAASGGGPSGIAAILAAFMLVPPLLLRAREGSVVRRPIDVLSRVDVPV